MGLILNREEAARISSESLGSVWTGIPTVTVGPTDLGRLQLTWTVFVCDRLAAN